MGVGDDVGGGVGISVAIGVGVGLDVGVTCGVVLGGVNSATPTATTITNAITTTAILIPVTVFISNHDVASMWVSFGFKVLQWCRSGSILVMRNLAIVVLFCGCLGIWLVVW